MNPKQAKYIKTIAEMGTVTAAARELYVSQPSLSQMLHQVEEELGLPIFDRSVSPFRLTYAGEKYLQAADRVLAATAQLESEIKEIKREHSGRLRLGISISRAMQVLPMVLTDFKAQYPNVDLELHEVGSAQIEELLSSGEVDLALAAVESTSPKFVYELIEKETIGILAGAGTAIAGRIAPGTPVSLEQTRGDSFAVMTRRHSARVIQDKLFRNLDFTPNVLVETDSLEVCRRVAVENGACMITPDIYIDDYVDRHGGVFFPLKDYENHRHFYACTRKGDFIPRYTRSFIRLVTAMLESRPAVTRMR